jgi:hypothetical protein
MVNSLARHISHDIAAVHQQEGYGIKVIDIEPALSLMREEYNAGKIIRLSDEQHKRLIEISKPDESVEQLMDRLMDAVSK